MAMTVWDRFAELCASIEATGPGARFITVDFHLHTPASGKDYPENTPEAYDEIVKELVSKGVDAVFVTDHNTWEGVEELAQAVKRAGADIVVYPGVELTIQAHAIHLADGKPKDEKKIKSIFFHCLALLPSTPDAAKRIEALVTNGFNNPELLDLPPVERKLVQEIADVAKQIHEWGGMFLPAHLNQGKSPEKSTSYDDIYDDAQAIRYLNDLFDAVEVRKLSSVEFFDGAHYGKNDEAIPEKVCVFGSDAHKPADAGKRVTKVLVEANEFEDIRTSLHYRERIAHESATDARDRLVELVVEGTFLGRTHIIFSDRFTTLIGTKGAGKTAILECLRFALGKQTLGDVDRYLDHVLGPAGTVWLKVVNRQGESFLFFRRRPDPEPKVYRENGDAIERDAVIPGNFDVELRGWGEIMKLAEDKTSQLMLIDTFDQSGDIRSLTTEVSEARDELEGTFDQIRDLYNQYRELNTELDDLLLKESRLQKLKVGKMIEQQQEKEARDTDIARYRELLAAIERNTAKEMEVLSPETEQLMKGLKEAAEKKDVTAGDVAGEAVQAIDKVRAQAADVSTQRKALLGTGATIVRNAISKLELRFAPLDEIYQEKIAALDPNEQDVLLARNEIVTELVKLPGVRSRADGVADVLIDRIHDYGNLLEDIHQGMKKRSKLRAAVAETLNTKLAASSIHTRIEIEHDILKAGSLPTGRGSADVFKTLGNEFKGLGKEDILDSELLTAYAMRDELKLEIDDRVRVEFELYPDVWRPTEKLSAGQKSTAVLPIVMMLGERPVVLDQPEDNLDNKYIGTTVVPTLLLEKQRKQIIVTSHNASVVVMADSELVIEMSDMEGKAVYVASGFLNGPHSRVRSSVLEILDGGEVALRRRFLKYGLDHGKS